MGSIPYILIVIYFLGLVSICVFVLARHDSSRTFQQAQQARQAEHINLSEVKKNAVSYGLLAAVFAFFLVLTVVLQHDTADIK
jgi:hypothetical protein